LDEDLARTRDRLVEMTGSESVRAGKIPYSTHFRSIYEVHAIVLKYAKCSNVRKPETF